MRATGEDSHVAVGSDPHGTPGPGRHGRRGARVASPLLAIGLGFGLLPCAISAGRAVERAGLVSPGGPDGTVVEGRCPAFSWTSVEGASAFELVVYEMHAGRPAPRPVLGVTLPGSASLWTPPLESCLERGRSYLWSVRTVFDDGSSEWAPPSPFEVSPGPHGAEIESLLARAEERLGDGGGEPGGLTSDLPIAVEGLAGAGAGATLAAAVGDAALEVNGAAVVTTSTLGADLCTALTYRWVDQGNGTVLDCHTGRVWLKDASCLGAWPWSDPDPDGTIFAKVAELNSGVDFGCADYTPGTYTDWQVPSLHFFCDAPSLGGGGCPSAYAATSLLDSSLAGNPKVANARGLGPWAEGDAFVGVKGGISDERYWTSTCFESCFIDAYSVRLFSGDFSPGSQVPSFWVWPVRSGP